MENQLEFHTDPNGFNTYKALVLDHGIQLGHGKLYVKVLADTAIELDITHGLRQFYAFGERIELDVEMRGSYYMVIFEREKGLDIKPWGVDLFEDVYQFRPTL